MLYLHYTPNVPHCRTPCHRLAGNAYTHLSTAQQARRLGPAHRHVLPARCIATDQSASQDATGGWGDRIRTTTTLHDLLDLIQQHSPQFSLSNACTAFAKLSRVCVRADTEAQAACTPPQVCVRMSDSQRRVVCALPFVQDLGQRVVAAQQQWAPHMAANVLYAHASLGHGPPGTLDAVCVRNIGPCF